MGIHMGIWVDIPANTARIQNLKSLNSPKIIENPIFLYTFRGSHWVDALIVSRARCSCTTTHLSQSQKGAPRIIAWCPCCSTTTPGFHEEYNERINPICTPKYIKIYIYIYIYMFWGLPKNGHFFN